MYQPVGKSSQLVYGKGTIMRENNQPKWPQTLKLNASKPLLAVKSNLLVYERDRKRAIRIIIPQNSTAIQTLERGAQNPQMMVQTISLPVSSNIVNDHDYCAKPNIESDNTIQQERGDHDYCLISHTASDESGSRLFSVLENSSDPLLILPHAANPMETVSEQATNGGFGNGHEIVVDSQTKLPPLINGNDFILPDVARDPSSACNNRTCVSDMTFLRSQLEEKSIALEACLTELDFLKQELGSANEHISNLRAQLEENTHAMCTYLAMGGPLA